MNQLELVRDTLRRVLPVVHGRYRVSLIKGEAVNAIDEGIAARLEWWTLDEEGEPEGFSEQEVVMVSASDAGAEPARVVAYLEGWARALPTLMDRAFEANDWTVVVYLVCPAALRDPTASDAEAFAALLLREDGPMKDRYAELAEPEPEELSEDAYHAFLEEEGVDSAEAAAGRRAEASERAKAVFEEVSAKVKEVYGLRLPRHVEVFWAFYTSLSPAERRAYEELEIWRPIGIMGWFEEGLERTPRDGLDPRLDWRFRSDPPEFVTVLSGGSDGQHFGLFYDDPAYVPSGVVVNYARDSAETWWEASTLLGVIQNRLELEKENLSEDYHTDVERVACQIRLLEEAIAPFADAEDDASEEDEAGMLVPYEARTQLPQIVCGVGVVGKDGTCPAFAYLAGGAWPAGEVLRTDATQTREWIREAEAALESGEPLFALALGRDLHWGDRDSFRTESLALMTRAYRALGREALAAIAEVHHAHRDLASVGIY
jgi:hypothetical protein